MAKWYVHQDGGDLGPYTSTEMRGLVVDGLIQLKTPIRREGQSDWVTARSVRHLFKTSCIRRSERLARAGDDRAAAPPASPPGAGEVAASALEEDGDPPPGAAAEDEADAREAVLAALEELDTGSEEDWDAFFQEQGRNLRGEDEAEPAARPRELVREAKRGRVEPRLAGPIYRAPAKPSAEDGPPAAGGGEDQAVADEASPSAIGEAVAILQQARGGGEGDPPPAAGPVTAEDIVVGPGAGGTSPAVVLGIVGLALAALGVVIWLLAASFAG